MNSLIDLCNTKEKNGGTDLFSALRNHHPYLYHVVQDSVKQILGQISDEEMNILTDEILLEDERFKPYHIFMKLLCLRLERKIPDTIVKYNEDDCMIFIDIQFPLQRQKILDLYSTQIRYKDKEWTLSAYEGKIHISDYKTNEKITLENSVFKDVQKELLDFLKINELMASEYHSWGTGKKNQRDIQIKARRDIWKLIKEYDS